MRGYSISYKIECGPNEDLDLPAHLSSVIRVFARHSVESQGSKKTSGGQQRHCYHWTDAQPDLSLHWAHIQSCRECSAPAEIMCLAFLVFRTIYTSKKKRTVIGSAMPVELVIEFTDSVVEPPQQNRPPWTVTPRHCLFNTLFVFLQFRTHPPGKISKIMEVSFVIFYIEK